jgi:predicted extracellular nuclease
VVRRFHAVPTALVVLAFALTLVLAAPGVLAAQPADLLISEMVEGSSLNKAVEIYNGTGAAVDLGLGGYRLEVYFNGSSSAGTTVSLSGVLAAGDVWVVADDGAGPAVLAVTDQTTTSSLFNGDDAIVLRKGGGGGPVLDSIGQVGFDPGSEWGSGDTSTGNNTLVRKATSCTGDTDLGDPFDPALDYDGFPQDTVSDLGSHTSTCGGPPPPPTADRLLLTELVVTPTAGEYVEIHNPNAFPVDLSDYYLTDATFAPGGVFYYNVVTGANAGGGGFSDFHARFPDGATIGAGEFQTVALAGSAAFTATYGSAPTYELYEDDPAPDAVPDLREALPGSISGQGGLTNSGEVAVLYFWDGASDLVTDVDYVLWGDKDEAVDKTGVLIDGPDAGADDSAYLPDTPVSLQDVVLPGAHPSGAAFVRIDFAEGAELGSGGNGVGGSDETSEDLSVTWGVAAPTPGAGLPAAWVINEIHADPAFPDGDANGDGTRDSTDDEFLELVNVSGAAVDISGWTLADGFGVRHVFPAGTVVADGCGVVVFGGGSPSGVFGGMTVQTASTGALGLNNSGDSVTLADGATEEATAGYGSEGGQNQSLTRDPDLTGGFVLHTLATGSGGALYSPGTRADGSPFDGCEAPPPAELEIYEIQGAGLASPVLGQVVTTLDNPVTALASNGFFIQTPDGRADADPETSNGVFVFTGGAPGVAVGDRVDVTGTVVEFFDFTELQPDAVTVISGGSALPAAVPFDAATPSPDRPQPATELERFEGMRVQVASGVVSGPNQRFGSDPIAEVHVVASADRAFREPGIELPGIAGLPVWDGNPEVFELDPDRLGLPNAVIPAGSTWSATGVLGYEFGGYELWPTDLTFDAALLPRPVPQPDELELTLGSLNLFRLFDDVDDPGTEDDGQVVSSAEYARRLAKFSLYVRQVLRAPDVLALQEAESLAVLEDLAAELAADDPALDYGAYLVEGNDVGGIDVGYLVREDRVRVDAVLQLAAGETLSVDGSPLHDRPPLLLEGAFVAGGGELPFRTLALHMRSLGGIDDPQDGPRVRQKRLEQAQSVAAIVQDLQTTAPDVGLAVLGDYNAFEFTDGYVDVVGQIAGSVEPADNLLSGPDLVDPDLGVLTYALPAGERYSFVFEGSAQTLDHALVTETLLDLVTGIGYGRGNADAARILLDDPATPLRSSDHDGLVVRVTADPDADGVPIGADLCPGTVLPEAVPTRMLLPGHYALVDGDTVFDTVETGLSGRLPVYTTTDTAGCSCEQIVEALHLGAGHLLHGCNRGVMERWTR